VLTSPERFPPTSGPPLDVSLSAEIRMSKKNATVLCLDDYLISQVTYPARDFKRIPAVETSPERFPPTSGPPFDASLSAGEAGTEKGDTDYLSFLVSSTILIF
jgi:hypothetical protein